MVDPCVVGASLYGGRVAERDCRGGLKFQPQAVAGQRAFKSQRGRAEPQV